MLARHPAVAGYADAPAERGGAGATIVRLRPPLPERPPRARSGGLSPVRANQELAVGEGPTTASVSLKSKAARHRSRGGADERLELAPRLDRSSASGRSTRSTRALLDDGVFHHRQARRARRNAFHSARPVRPDV